MPLFLTPVFLVHFSASSVKRRERERERERERDEKKELGF